MFLGCGGGDSTDLGLKSINTNNGTLTIAVGGYPAIQQYSYESNQTKIYYSRSGNIKPEANATANQEKILVAKKGEPVLFSAEGSKDVDGNITQYIWTNLDNKIVSNDINFTEKFCDSGFFEKTLTVVDNEGAYDQDRVCVLICMSEEDVPLTANAGPDIVVQGDANVTLSGHVVCKPGDYSYEWKEGDDVLSTEAEAKHQFTTGKHKVILTVTDNETGETACDKVIVTVEE